jgi:hypothetical protein
MPHWSRTHLLEKVTGFVLHQTPHLHNVVEEFSTFHVFHHNVDVRWGLDDLVQADDVWVVEEASDLDLSPHCTASSLMIIGHMHPAHQHDFGDDCAFMRYGIMRRVAMCLSYACSFVYARPSMVHLLKKEPGAFGPGSAVARKQRKE